jgi:hypothetical protein
MRRAPLLAAAIHVAADVFLIVFGAAFAGLALFSVMVLAGGAHG